MGWKFCFVGQKSVFKQVKCLAIFGFDPSLFWSFMPNVSEFILFVMIKQFSPIVKYQRMHTILISKYKI